MQKYNIQSDILSNNTNDLKLIMNDNPDFVVATKGNPIFIYIEQVSDNSFSSLE